MSEELVQYRHHIVSAKEIGKALLQGVPDNSPFHKSITAAQETLYYINSIGRAVHPSNGSSFLFNRSSFFSGAPEYKPQTKVRVVSSTKTRGQLQSEQQHSEEEATFESPKAQPQPNENLPSTSRAKQFQPGSRVNDPLTPIKQTLYPQYDVYNVDINNPLYDTKAYVAQCPPKNTCYCGRGCNSQKDLAGHIDRRHSDGIYECVVCDYHSENARHVWKHYRIQHLYIHTHVCKVKGCKDGKNNKPYGNDE